MRCLRPYGARGSSRISREHSDGYDFPFDEWGWYSYSSQSVQVDQLSALGFSVRHWSSKKRRMSCTTPQCGPHTEEQPNAPSDRSALSRFRGSAKETRRGERDTRENEGPEVCETRAVGCEDRCWGGRSDRGCFRLVSNDKPSQIKETHI